MLLLLTLAGGVSASGPMVVDSKGHAVGTYFPNPDVGEGETAVRQINGVFYALPVTQSGFFVDSEILFFYGSSDCSGSPLFNVPPNNVPPNYLPLVFPVDGQMAGIINQTLYFANGTPQQLNVCSEGLVDDPSLVPTRCGACSNPPLVNSPVWTTFAPVGTFDLSKLKLKPPFKFSP